MLAVRRHRRCGGTHEGRNGAGGRHHADRHRRHLRLRRVGTCAGGGFGDAEELLGRVLADTPGLRDRMVLATKGGITPPVPYDSSSTYLRDACEASLRRLQTDVIDLYQIHRPDLLANPADVARTLDELVTSARSERSGCRTSPSPRPEPSRNTSTLRSQPSTRVLAARPRPDHRWQLRPRDGDRPRRRSRGARSPAVASPATSTPTTSCGSCPGVRPAR